jgi:DNA-binding LacI/PurR family transcriptional regulator
VIGSGNIPEDRIANPPLTTIGPRDLDFGPVVDLLFSRLRGEAPPEGRIYRLPRKLILRGSA